jgi:hypothetical protein
MNLSTSHRFLFVHVPKTAGTSIRHALESVAKPRNRTPVQRLLSHLPVRQDPDRVYLRTHDTAAWARVKLGADYFDALRRYAVIRNPYDVAVSYFRFYQIQKSLQFLTHEAHSHFPEFVKGLKSYGRTYAQCHWIEGKDGTLLVPDILFFERLEVDFSRFLDETGLQGIPLGRKNVSGSGDYRDYYDPASRSVVEEIFARDFKRFQYDFETGQPDWNAAVQG